MDIKDLGNQFAKTLGGKAKLKQKGCSVSMERNFQVVVEGRASKSVLPVVISFEALDTNGLALNLAEITILEEEIKDFSKLLVEQGLLISALHNHWVHTEPNLMYIHIQSVEEPLSFAKKIAGAYRGLKSLPLQGS